jgi:hypothetical protein
MTAATTDALRAAGSDVTGSGLAPSIVDAIGNFAPPMPPKTESRHAIAHPGLGQDWQGRCRARPSS